MYTVSSVTVVPRRQLHRAEGRLELVWAGENWKERGAGTRSRASPWVMRASGVSDGGCLKKVLEPSKCTFKNVNFDISTAFQKPKIKTLTSVCQVESGLEGAVGPEPGKLWPPSPLWLGLWHPQGQCSSPYSPPVVLLRAAAVFRRCGLLGGN